MNEHDWIWRPNSVTFKRNYFAHTPEFGKQSHVFGSPYWSFELQLPPKKDDDRRAIDTFLANTEGRDVVNVYDPRVPYPKFYDRFKDEYDAIAIESMIKPLNVKALARATSTITVSGEAGDRITMDDPIAFTHLGIRHYYRAAEDLDLTGSDQVLKVTLRPRVTITGLDITTVRIRPTQRFLIDINNTGGQTDANSLTSFSLRGIEFFGVIL